MDIIYIINAKDLHLLRRILGGKKMKKKYWKCGVFILIFVYILMGCTPKTTIEESNYEEIEVQSEESIIEPGIKVYASFYPLYDFAKKVGGELVDGHVIVPDGADPHSFEPSPKLLTQLETADVFIYNGLGMEPWLEGVLELLEDKDIIIIEASKDLDLIKFSKGDDHDHDHEKDDHDHDHDHGEYDPHIWLDPIHVMEISERIKESFVEIDSNNIGIYEGNFIAFRRQLEQLDEDFKEELKDIVRRKILVSHSAFGYLAHRYDIEQISIAGVSPHEEPSPKRLSELTKKAQEYNIKYIFFEVLANPRTAEVLANETNLETLMLYNIEGLTAEQRQAGEDYISLMYKNLENLKKALVK